MLKARVVLRWAARLTSIGVVALLMQFASGEDFSKASAREWVGLSFFPLGVIIGLAAAWWREALGAAVTASSVSAFYVVYGALLGGRVGGPWFVVFASPAALFFASWVCGRWHMKEAGVAATRA